MLRLRHLLACLGLALSAAVAAAPVLNAELSLGYDSNLNNGRLGWPERSAAELLLAIGLERQRPLGAGLLRGGPRLELHSYDDYPQLSSARLELAGDYRRRLGSGLFDPTLMLAAGLALQDYGSRLRDQREWQLGAAIEQRLSTRLRLRLSLDGRWQQAGDTVFDLHHHEAGLQLDWTPLRHWTLYGGGRLRQGDFATTGASVPAGVTVFAADDAFVDGELAYRRPGESRLWNLGLNWGLSPHWALDLQGLRVHTESRLGTEYRRWQTQLSLLGRF
ncbi:MAG: hypothetical protein EPN60_13230 [Nevskiaceae bacterium]|nr:MAG: hypothetical protein EPO48_02765 [Nevskiaceae bacterium]TAM24761.1 MAG: hypothetical protein EPN60_13230 [Nevskiaceae bacterium]